MQASDRHVNSMAVLALIKGAVADFGRSCLPGRTSRLAAISVHVNRQYRLAVSLARRTRFACGESPFRQTHLYPHLFRDSLVSRELSGTNVVSALTQRGSRTVTIRPIPALRRVSMGLETTEPCKMSNRPHPASRRWTFGLTTRSPNLGTIGVKPMGAVFCIEFACSCQTGAPPTQGQAGAKLHSIWWQPMHRMLRRRLRRGRTPH